MIEMLRVVEIEINGFCNRKCPWCPNSKIDRKKNNPMPFMTYMKVIRELKKHNFQGTISYSRNNEPFADFRQLRAYTLAAAIMLPKVRLVTNTNGDFLTKTKILLSGIDELSIMDYDCKGMEKCKQQLLDWKATITDVINNVIYADLNGVKIAYCTDWPKNTVLEDKGGFLKKEGALKNMEFRADLALRDYPCVDPAYFLAIDYDGSVMPCCQMRHDNPEHKDFILGNVAKDKIEDILQSKKYIEILGNTSLCTGKDLPLPCQHCQKGVGRYTRDNPSIYFSERYRNGVGPENVNRSLYTCPHEEQQTTE